MLFCRVLQELERLTFCILGAWGLVASDLVVQRSEKQRVAHQSNGKARVGADREPM